MIIYRRRKFSTNLSPSGRIGQVQNTTSCHNYGTMNVNSIRISTVRGHAPYKYPPRNTMPKYCVAQYFGSTPVQIHARSESPGARAIIPFPLRSE